MSWDISIVTNTGRDYDSHIAEVRNFTYNNSAILSALDLHPEGREQLTCLEWAKLIARALEVLPDKLQALEKLEPANKWGGIDDTVSMLMELYPACIRHPNAKVRW